MKEEKETTKSDAIDPEDAIIGSLGKLPILEYERRRKKEAEQLGCRESILDELVAAQRKKHGANGDLQGSAIKLLDVELWPEPVDGEAVLNEIAKIFRKYIILPQEQADILTIWCAHAHGFRAFICSPRLNICS